MGDELTIVLSQSNGNRRIEVLLVERVIRFGSLSAGMFGFVYPMILFAVGRFYLDEGITVPTISDYYYSDLRWLFIGGLVFVALAFLILSPIMLRSTVIGIAFFVLASGTAYFPTADCVLKNGELVRHMTPDAFVHLLSAVGLLVLFSVVLLKFMGESGHGRKLNKKAKFNLEIYYIFSGFAVLVLVAAGLAIAVLGKVDCISPHYFNGVIFWFEAFPIMIFCAAWIAYSLNWHRSR